MSLRDFLYNKTGQYWLAQVLGWGGYFTLVYFVNDKLQEDDLWINLLAGVFVLRILITHAFRWVVIRFNWFRYKPAGILWRTVLACMVMGSVDTILGFILNDTLTLPEPFDWEEVTVRVVILDSFVSSIFFAMWSAIYFAFHYVGKSRQEEIKNIQFEASKTEIELKNLKAQLNPHFMFNSMNSIRALVDEEPDRAKFAITQLSSILRNTLLMGKSKTVSIKDELSVVKDYLSLEGIRYEERLKVEYAVQDEVLGCEIPPMMIQTLVENAIKHGISKLPAGGNLLVSIGADADRIEVIVENSGTLQSANPETGIGLRNTIKRLDLLYGNDSEFSIKSITDKVITKFSFPKVTVDEGYRNR